MNGNNPSPKAERSLDSLSLRERLFRECEAMLDYAGEDGPIGDTVSPESVAILGLDDRAREKVPLADLVRLQRELAAAVAPAKPRTIALIHETRTSSGWSYFVPLPALGWLIVATLLIGAITGGFAFAKWKALTDPDCIQPGALLVLYGLLGALGALFAALYDAYTYMRQGTYDDDLGSTYAIRTLIGVFTGLLLASVLSDYIHSPAVGEVLDEISGIRDRKLSPAVEREEIADVLYRAGPELREPLYAPAFLAFLGGFAAQLVFDLLSRVVDSISNLFRPDRRRERAILEREFALLGRERAGEATAKQRAGVEAVLAAGRAIRDPAARAAWIDEALAAVLAGREMPPPPPGAAGAPMSVRLEQALRSLRGGLAVAGLLPEAEAAPHERRLEQLQAELSAAAEALATEETPETRRAVERLMAEAAAASPLRPVLEQATGLMEGQAGGRTAEVAFAILNAAVTLDDPAYRRWKVAALGAERTDPAIGLEGVTDDEARAVAATLGDEAQPLAAAIGGAATGQGFVARLRAGEEDALFAAVGGGFASRAAFDDSLDHLRDALLRRGVARDLAAAGVAADEAAGREILDLLRALLGDTDGVRGAQMIALVADRVRVGEIDEAVASAVIRETAAT